MWNAAYCNSVVLLNFGFECFVPAEWCDDEGAWECVLFEDVVEVGEGADSDCVLFSISESLGVEFFVDLI